jgi:hypothetical protein
MTESRAAQLRDIPDRVLHRLGEVAALRVGRVNPLHGRLEMAESVEEVHGKLVYGPP